MAKYPTITTPKGTIIVTESGRAILTWNPGFGPVYTGKFKRWQKWVDQGVLQGMEPYTPLKTGMMIMSATLGSELGSGFIKYLAYYSPYQYYAGRVIGKSSTGSRRGRLWFARWKAEKGREFVNAAKELIRADNG